MKPTHFEGKPEYLYLPVHLAVIFWISCLMLCFGTHTERRKDQWLRTRIFDWRSRPGKSNSYFSKIEALLHSAFQRPSSEEAGTQFFRFLTRRENAVSRKRSYAWLSWQLLSSQFMACFPSFRMCMASLIHLLHSASVTVSTQRTL